MFLNEGRDREIISGNDQYLPNRGTGNVYVIIKVHILHIFSEAPNNEEK